MYYMSKRAESGPDARRGNFGDFVIAIAVTILGLGNLALPEQAQTLFGVDYLLLSLSVLALFVILRLALSLSHGLVWIVAFVVALAALPGFLVTQLGDYGQQKLQTIIIVAVCLVAVGSMRRPRLGIVIFIAVGLAVSLLFAGLLVVDGVMAANGRVSVLGLNPVGVARLTALGIIIPLVFLMAARVSAVRVGISVGVMMLCAGATLMTSSRGPIVAAVAAIGLAFLVTLRGRRANLLLAIGLVAAVAGTVAIGYLDPAESIGWSSGRQDSGRFILYGSAIEQTLADPLGLGWGNFGQLFGWTSGAFYPHNIFLEIAVEGGIFALLGIGATLLIALFWGFANFRRSRDVSDLLILSIYVYSLVNAQFSSDLVGNRILWISMAFIVATRALGPEGRPISRRNSVGQRQLQ